MLTVHLFLGRPEASRKGPSLIQAVLCLGWTMVRSLGIPPQVSIYSYAGFLQGHLTHKKGYADTSTYSAVGARKIEL